MHGMAKNTQSSTRERQMPGRRGRTRRAAIGIVALGAVLAGWIGWRYVPNRGAIDGDRSLLVQAAGSYRTTEGRLSGFGYGGIRPSYRSADAVDNVSLLTAAATLQQRAKDRPDARSIATYGVARLLLGDTQGAVKQLEDALLLGEPAATLRSDLSVAYLARAVRLGTAEDRFKALALTERSLSTDGRCLEALFNRALALESLGLQEAARRAWAEYVAIDASSEWSREASRRMSALGNASFKAAWDALRADYSAGRTDASRLVSHGAGLARDFLERDLLPAWAKAESAGSSSESRAAFEKCRRLADAIREGGHDSLFVDELTRIESLSPERRVTAAHAHIALSEARVLHELYRHESAIAILQSVRHQLTTLDLPSASIAHFYQGVAHYYLGKRAEATVLLVDVADMAERRRYPHLSARALSALGILLAGQAQYAKALDAYGRAQRAYDVAMDRPSVAYIDNLVAEVLHLSGLYKDSFRASFRALEQTPAFVDARRLQSVLFVAAAVSRKAGYPETAAHFQRAFVDIAEASGVPTATVEGRIGLAMSLGEMGRVDAAAREFQTAEDSIARESQPARQQYLRGELLSARGAFAIASRPSAAVQDLRGAIDTLTSLGRKERTPQLYLELARAQRAAGEGTAAHESTTRAVAALDDEWGELLGRGLTTARLEQLWGLLGQAALDRFERAGAAAAFDLVERYKSALLRGERPAAESPSLKTLAGALPADVGAVFIVPTDEATLVWSVVEGREYSSRLPISNSRIRDLLTLLERQFAAGRDPAALEQLYDAFLAAPLTEHLGATRSLAITAVGAAARIPWNALRNARTHRYLVQDYTIWTFPSVEYLAACPPATLDRRQVLIVSNPTVDQPFLELPPLPETLAEGREISAAYRARHAVVELTAQQATKTNFAREIGRSAIIHFGGHAVATNEGDEAAALVLAGANYESALLRARDVRLLPLSHRPLVVLAACRTGEPPTSIGPGASSLAGAFLSAGARATVSTLWQVEDAASHALTVEFHRVLETGASPATALRSAVMRRLEERTDYSPRTWGAYQVSGCLAASSARPIRERQP